ncbi:MAG: GGDEF domain-containing protein, partial [Xanthomonadales bacterium]|nr:GGDEF domain-containing protein [Xanthomonadales bacterium]
VDLDHFKRINDRLGHPAGDMVLRQFGAILRDHVRADDVAARIGGEEIAVLLPETALDHARDYSERLRETVAATRFDAAGEQLEVTISIGLALIAEGRDSVSTLMRSADRGLYRAKSEGRNRVRSED